MLEDFSGAAQARLRRFEKLIFRYFVNFKPQLTLSMRDSGREYAQLEQHAS
jgi:hypothetical protein